MQADAFSGYDGIYAGGGVVEVGCNAARAAQVRRGADDGSRAGGRGAGLLPPALRHREGDQGGDRQAAAEDADEPARAAIRLRVRQERAVPVWEASRQWLEAQRPDVLPKSPLGGAIGYVQNNWEALKRYTSSGYLSIDNNVSEQHMKTIATGRKNWLFTGSEDGGKTMAVLFSVVSSCQRHGHDPFVYLRDVLTRLPDHPKERLAELLPDRWTPPKASRCEVLNGSARRSLNSCGVSRGSRRLPRDWGESWQQDQACGQSRRYAIERSRDQVASPLFME